MRIINNAVLDYSLGRNGIVIIEGTVVGSIFSSQQKFDLRIENIQSINIAGNPRSEIIIKCDKGSFYLNFSDSQSLTNNFNILTALKQAAAKKEIPSNKHETVADRARRYFDGKAVLTANKRKRMPRLQR